MVAIEHRVSSEALPQRIPPSRDHVLRMLEIKNKRLIGLSEYNRIEAMADIDQYKTDNALILNSEKQT